MVEMNGGQGKNPSGIYRLTLDEHGIPCLDGKRITGVRSYTVDVDDLSLATLTVSLYVRLNAEISHVTKSEEIISAVQRGLDEANRDIASKSQGNSSEQS